ncbi:PRA1 protein H [Ancistrocladus abbreviatus]
MPAPFSSKPNKPSPTNTTRATTQHYRKASFPFPFSLSPPCRRAMVFSSNPLSLSVPEHAFESWLRDSGYLEILDQRTTELHRLNNTTTTTTAPSTSSSAVTTTKHRPSTTTVPTTTVTAIAYGIIMSIISAIVTIFSVFTLNPFSKLTTDDFSGQTPSWTHGFVGSCNSYSFPSTPAHARMRVHENVKRFTRNYATLFILFFACTLYQMPLTLVGLVSCLGLWDFCRFCNGKWVFDRYPLCQQILIRAAQCAGAIILLFSNVQLALFFTLGVSYAVMMLHASFRKLTPAKQPSKGRWR